MSNSDDTLQLVGLAIALVFIVPALFGWFVDNREILAKNVETVVDTGVITADQLCNAQKIMDEIDKKLQNIPNEIVSNYPTETWEDARVKVLLEKYKDGVELTQNEYLTIAEDMNKYQKLKTKIYDLEKVCDIKNILENNLKP